MFVENDEYYTALGVEAPEPETEPTADSAEESETAAPDTPESESGENGQETAAPAQDPQEPQEQPAEEKEQQTREENSRYAAIRRRAEQEAKRKAEHELDSLLAGAGIENPYTKEPIKNRADLESYRTRYREEQRREFQEHGNMTDEQYESFVSELPEVQKAREQNERFAAIEVQAQLEHDLKEIAKHDPAVTSIEVLAQQETYPDLCKLVERGYTLSDAYTLTHLEEITAKRAEAAHQAALNSVNQKQHLEKTEQRGEGGITVPADIIAEYRLFLPGATDEEIRQHYAAYQNAK